MRKTIKIDDVKDRVNNILLHTMDVDKEARNTMAMFIENILIETGNYKGFKYLDQIDMLSSINGVSYGIDPTTEDQFAVTDNTRVKYY